jgi:hypothetical protein
MNRRFYIIPCLLIALFFSLTQPCRGAEEKSVDIQSIKKIAILPAAVGLEAKDIKDEAAKTKLAYQAGEILRQQMDLNLKGFAYKHITADEVDRALLNSATGETLDPIKTGTQLGVDGVIKITVLKVSNDRGGLLSSTSLKAVAELISIKSKEIAWSVEESESISSGLIASGAQAAELLGEGMSSNEALLRRDLLRVAQNLARRMCLTMPDPHRDLNAPNPMPVIHSADVVASTESLEVKTAMSGTPGRRASFDLLRPDGTCIHADLPMEETYPGQYRGAFVLAGGGKASAVVRLMEGNGICAKQAATGQIELESKTTMKSAMGTITETKSEYSVSETKTNKGGKRTSSRRSGSKSSDASFDAAYQRLQPRVLAIAPLYGKGDKKKEGAVLLRQTLFGSLFDSNYRLISNLAVERALHQNDINLFGIYTKEDVMKIAKLTGADVVMTGEVTRWSRSYALIQSTVSAGLKIKIHDGTTGKVLVEMEDKVSVSKGLTGIPTGIGSAVIAPISGMKKRFLYQCAFDLSTALSNTLTCTPAPPKSKKQRKNAPISPLQDATLKGADKPLNKGDVISVELQVEGGGIAYFNVGNTWSYLPMHETSPGKYSGAYTIRKGDRLQADLASVVFLDKNNRRWTKNIEKPTLSKVKK